MKFLFVASFFLLAISTLSVQAATESKVLPPVFKALLSCQKKYEVTETDLIDIMSGNFGQVKNRAQLLTCFTDCFSKEMGFLSADNKLDISKFKSSTVELLNAFDLPVNIIDGCIAKAKETKDCGVTGPAIECILDTVPA